MPRDAVSNTTFSVSIEKQDLITFNAMLEKTLPPGVSRNRWMGMLAKVITPAEVLDIVRRGQELLVETEERKRRKADLLAKLKSEITVEELERLVAERGLGEKA